MKTLKRIICAVLALYMLAGAGTAQAASPAAAWDAYAGAARYLCQQIETPQPGSVGGEWLILGLLRGGYAVPDGYFARYEQELTRYVTQQQGVLSTRKYTEYSRVVLALTAMGKDPGSVGGWDLLRPLGDYEKTVLQGISGPVWALIALDSGNYDMPQNAEAAVQATRELYLKNILNRQLADGGFALGGTAADPDTTAMALTALSSYRGRPDVDAAVERAINCLSALQRADGGYLSGGADCAESASQVLMALCALDIGAEDLRFVKNGNTVTDHLLTFQCADGGFAHTPDAGQSNGMATEQALLALAALIRAEEGQNGFFQFREKTRTVRVAGELFGGASARNCLVFQYRNNRLVWVVKP